jgi:hypothetical protein
MAVNNDRWSALSMKERADLIKLYVSNGIVSLNDIKKSYNSFTTPKEEKPSSINQSLQESRVNKFGPGGEKESIVKKSKPGNWLQRLAYKFGSDPEVSAKGIASMEDILRILKSSEDINWDELDNNKATYLFGNILGLFPAGETKGKDYSNYLKKNYPLKHILGKIKEYEGTINPFNEYVIDSRDRGLVEELAKKGKGLYSNSDIEYSYMFDAYDPPPYKEDVANYHMQFVNTPNGIAVSASDLYDFGKDYNPEDYDDSGNNSYNNLLTDMEIAAFTAVGNPFIYRQENIPIRFIDTSNNTDEEDTRALELSRAWNWANLSDEDLEKGISFEEKIANILDTGYIEPAIVTAEAKSKGGKINRFDGGGDTKATLVGKVRFNPFKAFNRNYRGTNIYESDNFGDAFRQARIDGEDMFVWNDTVYSTELKPNEFVEAAKVWDTQGDLAKEDFRMSIIRNPQGVLEYYNDTYPKGKYTTANRKINEYDIPFMYSLGTKGLEDLVMNRYENLNIGDAIWEELANSDLSYEQKIAVLANSYHETNGWTALKQYGNGPASGIYMMEGPQREVYNKWLSDNSLTDSYANQTKFVVSLFDNKDSSLKTAWDRAGDKHEEIKAYKDSKEAEAKGYRSAYNHMDYTTKQAFKDWNSSDLDATTTAFEGLFERAGVPALENRKRIAHILSKKYK